MQEQITITEQVTTEKVVTVIAVHAYQWFIDGTDRYKPGGITFFRGYLISDEGQIVGERSFLFSGEFYKNKVGELTNPELTHREDFLEVTNQVLTEVATDQALKDSLIASGELEIDVAFRPIFPTMNISS